MKGFGTLTSARDLFKKLQFDLSQLGEAPSNVYRAFDFFVTAEHMLDWLYPGDPGSGAAKKRSELRKSELLLQVVSHVANGAKHFAPSPDRHDSVTHVNHANAPYGAGPYGAGPYGGGLVVTLEGDAAAAFGDTVSALALAESVVAYWAGHPDLR